MLSFQRLDGYQRSTESFAHALEIIDELPSKGHAEIADPLRRAAESQPLNIAEGAGRTSRPDIAKHDTIARGSATKLADNRYSHAMRRITEHGDEKVWEKVCSK